MEAMENKTLPWWEKQTLSLKEASAYFGISYKCMRRLCKEHRDENFILWRGNRAMIKRAMFQKFLEEELTVI